MNYVLGVDIGTYSSKGVLLSADGEVVAEAAAQHELSMPEDGHVEHDAERIWWGDFRTITRELLETPGVRAADIAAVGASGIAPCVLPVDGSGTPLRPAILYGVDTRATAEIHWLNDRLGTDWVLRHARTRLDSQSAGPKILWVRNHEPEVWKSTRCIMTASGYLAFRLTGNTAIDHYTAAFYAPLYDLESRQWNAEASRVICPLELLPRLAWTSDVIGKVTREAARETGLSEGTPVIAGTADASAEAVGAGVTEIGDTMIMFGSSVFMINWSRTLPGDGVFWSAPALTPETFAVAAGMSTAGSLTRWFRDQLGPGAGRGERGSADGAADSDDAGALARDYQELMAAAAAVAPGSEGLLALPYFSGERTPIKDPLARGVIAGLTLRHTRAQIYRALLESVAMGVRHNVERMEESGVSHRNLVTIGGGTKNGLWMQIVADVLGRRHTARHTAGASFGDAILAAAGSGMLESLSAARRWVPAGTSYTPDSDRHALYTEMFDDYLRLYEATREIIHRRASARDPRSM